MNTQLPWATLLTSCMQFQNDFMKQYTKLGVIEPSSSLNDSFDQSMQQFLKLMDTAREMQGEWLNNMTRLSQNQGFESSATNAYVELSQRAIEEGLSFQKQCIEQWMSAFQQLENPSLMNQLQESVSSIEQNQLQEWNKAINELFEVWEQSWNKSVESQNEILGHLMTNTMDKSPLAKSRSQVHKVESAASKH